MMHGMSSAAGARWMTELGATTDAFAALLEARTADLTAPVGACPGWDLAGLAAHLGGVHAWATHAVRAHSPDHEPARAPSGRRALSAWYRAQAADLIATLEDAGETGPAWTLHPPDGRAGFWRRRQVHETRMHLWDARTAAGLSDAIEPALARDGLTEVRDVFYPRQLRLGRVAPLARTLVLVPADVDAPPVRFGAGHSVEVRAPADTLLRLVWHREPWSSDYGDAAAEVLLATALTP